MNTQRIRLAAAFASFALTLVLFQGVASLAHDPQASAPQQMAALADASTGTVRQ